MENGERVLFVHAHPHDVAVATGGTIAALVTAGADVVVTIATGEEDHIRVAEVMRELGVDDYRFLGAANARWKDRAPRIRSSHEATRCVDS
jgi:N-acetyl-1-D-myo-inositol-2-amino-2-deoxy-alpha-D-glucopyranoside deacetylase